MNDFPMPVEKINADVIIIGAGSIGGLMSWELSQKGLKVAVLDSGPVVDRAQAVERFKNSPDKTQTSAYERKPWAPIPQGISDYIVQEMGQKNDLLKQAPFNGSYLRCIGGTTWHWTGHAERRYLSDFKMQTLFGRGIDWPIDYDELEPYYERVEKAWGVAGDQYSIGPPRRSSYPLPPVPMTYLDQQVAKAAKELGIHTAPFAHARNSIPFDGRAQCCGNSSCRAICPTGAKYDASVHINKAQALGARIYANRVANFVEVNDQKQVSGIRYLNFDNNADGVQGLATGRIYILAAHGIETPKLMLMSKSKNAPNGLSNSSDQVGRNLMSNGYVETMGYTPMDNPVYPYRGPVSATASFVEMRDGPFRKDYAAFDGYINNGAFNPFEGPKNQARELIKQGLLGKQLNQSIASMTSRQILLESSAESLPHPHNRITLADQNDVIGLPRPKIEFRLDEYTLQGLLNAWKRQLAVLKRMGVTDAKGQRLVEPDDQTAQQFVRGLLPLDYANATVATAVIAGTVRFGHNRKTDVVNSYCKSYDHSNLYVVGTSNFPTAGLTSPTETAAAIALRAVDEIIKNLSSNVMR